MSILVDSWGWGTLEPQPVAAYVHVPFCRHRCGYCNFSLLANRDDLFDRYLDAIERELAWLETPRPVATLFLGGGTPSILNESQLVRLTEALHHWLLLAASSSSPQGGPGVSPGVARAILGETPRPRVNPMISDEMPLIEWSIEANPLDITHEFCRTCQRQGIDRISIGGQSFDATKLRRLERDHSPEELVQAIRIAKEYFQSVSIDLIFGVPGEPLEAWNADLEKGISLDVDHVSTYGLTYEKGARFWSLREKGELKPVEEESELAMYLRGIERLEEAGYEHYEISNFSKPGFACLHNQAYWQGRGWWGFGPSAARFVGRTRSVNHRGTLEYMRRVEQDESPVVEVELLDDEQLLRERFVFGMRQRSGVDWDVLAKEAPREIVDSIEATMAQHIANGWLTRQGGRILLTQQGLVVSDGLWNEYL